MQHRPLIAKLYFPDIQAEPPYTTKSLHKVHLIPDKWQIIAVNIPEPAALAIMPLCFVPMNTNGVTSISTVKLIEPTKSDPSWTISKDNNFSGISLRGEAILLFDKDNLLVFSTMDNPMINIDFRNRQIDFSRPLIIEICVNVSRNQACIHRLQHPLILEPPAYPPEQVTTGAITRPFSDGQSFPVADSSIEDELPTIVFHIGVQKTATKSIQELLRNNARLLAKKRVRYIDIWKDTGGLNVFFQHVRRSWTCSGLAEFDSLIEEWMKFWTGFTKRPQYYKSDTILFSFENILGEFDLAKNKILYPHIRDTACLIKHLFPRHRIKILCSVRSYDTYIESIYSLYVRLGGSMTFDNWFSCFDCYQLSWIDFINELTALFGTDNVIVSRYEDFPANMHDMLSKAIGHEAASVLDWSKARMVNYSLSKIELDIMTRVAGVLTEDELREFRIFFIRKLFSKNRGYEKADHIREVLRNDLKARYEEHCKQLNLT